MSGFAAALFDMDGVVVDTEATVAAFWRSVARDEGFAISDEDMDRHVHGRSALHTLRHVFPDLPEHRHGEVYERMRVDNETLRYSGIPGASALLAALADGGVPLALVTGAQSWKADAVLGQLGLAGLFGVRVSAEDVAAGKPDPACYRLAAERLGVPIARCVVFEDAVSGVTSAVAAGATCVALAAPHRVDAVRAAGASAVVGDLSGVRFDAALGVLDLDGAVALPLSGARAARAVTP
ncbi:MULTISPECIES: HAD family phosphatase [Actinosynnema]|uniref:HAD family hydrolase n=1 Tax=Actinosynnema TaxID=40566 RepID=UPI0020A27C56|nr:HAD family phosphatase [Actinosynnema pretiosum]MCP2098730.1 haloacid dehalogenase superfamily, subfamily IA, variant 3 with third motif having DD or ED [Actinosynnema pretiosum]